MVNADATNKWYNESASWLMKLDYIISAIGIIFVSGTCRIRHMLDRDTSKRTDRMELGEAK
jgi:hypothetical protein